jgi:hypothetical protein
MTRNRNVLDPVWGEVRLSEDEWRIINLPCFQRLRRIHQLGLTMLVFPGATHSRFGHSLGACHAAGEVAARLRATSERSESPVEVTEDDERLVRLAALVHDLGHGPFSHVSDPFLNAGGVKGHEWVGSMIIETDAQIRDILGQDTVTAICRLLRGEDKRSVQRDIVSGPADADKLDYLLRDSHYAGVRYGVFDHNHFIDQVAAIKFSATESWLGFRWAGLWAVEGMLLARHHLHRAVYGHRNRLVTDYMLERGLRSAMDGTTLPADLLTLPHPSDFESWNRTYQTYDDWRVMTIGVEAQEPIAKRMFTRLRDHDLLKLLVYVEDDDLKQRLGTLAVRAVELGGGDKLVPEIEPAIAKEIGCDPSEVIVRLLDPKHVLAGPSTSELGDEDIYVGTFDRQGYEPFRDRSEIYSATKSDRWRRKLLVYAPMGMKDESDRSKKTDLSERIERLAVDLVKTRLTAAAV